jgi:hypothetical protein
MMAMLLLSLLLPTLAVFLLFSFLWPLRQTLPGQRVLQGCLAVGAGLGLSSVLLFAWLVLAGAPDGVYTLTETACFLTLSGVLGVALRRRKKLGNGQYTEKDERGEVNAPTGEYPVPSTGFSEPGAPTPRVTLQRLVMVLLVTGVILKLLQFLFQSLLFPHGEHGDAWYIWNLRARFLYCGGDDWRDAFSAVVSWSHADYPLLLPLSVVRGWHFLGRETTFIPALVALLFTFATVGVLLGAVAVLRGRTQGCLAALVLLSLPYFLQLGSDQYADVPLSFFLLGTLVLLCLRDTLVPQDLSLVTLAGLLAGCAAWTKNEGLLFVACVLVARLLVGVRRGWRGLLRETSAFLVGLLPTGCALLYFKTQLAPPNDLIAGQGWEPTLERLADFSRSTQVLKAMGDEVVKSWVAVLLPVYFLLLGRRPSREGPRPVIGSVVLVVGLMLLGYFLVYVTTPNELEEHLVSSLNRVLMHLWPVVIFLFFLSVASPEEALGPCNQP